MNLDAVGFIWRYTIFIFTLIQVSALIGGSLIGNAPPAPTIPSSPGILDLLGWVVGNVGYFLVLMTVSTDFAILGAVVFAPGIITLAYILMELIATAIPL